MKIVLIAFCFLCGAAHATTVGGQHYVQEGKNCVVYAQGSAHIMCECVCPKR
jgi:hypothetical protein